MPTVEGVVVSYSLYVIPPGRFPFTRWSWEVWHGAALIATGWRTSPTAAERAVQKYGASFGHQMFGLRAAEPPVEYQRLTPGCAVRIQAGPVTLQLVPRGLETH